MVDALIGESPVTFLVASILLILAPGPDMAIVARNTLARGRGEGLRTAAGAMAGVSVHVAAAVAGLSALLTGSDVAFTVVKFAGAAYLAYLGVRAIIEAGVAARRDGAGAAFGGGASPVALAATSPTVQGALSALLNPKLAVFFLTFLPQFVDADDLPQASMLAHGAVFVAMASVWMVCWVLALHRLSALLQRPVVRAWMERATGVVLILMALRLAIDRG